MTTTVTPEIIRRTIHLLPQNTTLEELQALVKYLHPWKNTFAFSADDCHALMAFADSRSAVHVWDGHRWSGDIYGWFYSRGVTVIKRSFKELYPAKTPIPPPTGGGTALMGLHASADPSISQEEVNEFNDLRPGVIKILSFHEPSGIGELAKNNPGIKWIVRPFLDFGGRKVTPQDFANWTISDTSRTLNVLSAYNIPSRNIIIELHNEPNLVSEGLNASWGNGREFGDWLLEVHSLYKAAFPGMQYMYPGLSPGVGVPGIRENHYLFIMESMHAISKLDAFGVHLYWSFAAPMSAALETLRSYLHFVDKPVWVTEASNNREVGVDQRADEYVNFWRELRVYTRVQGVTYFVASASNPSFSNETWVDKGLAKRVRARMT